MEFCFQTQQSVIHFSFVNVALQLYRNANKALLLIWIFIIACQAMQQIVDREGNKVCQLFLRHQVTLHQVQNRITV